MFNFVESITETITDIRIAFENASTIEQFFGIFLLLFLFVLTLYVYIINFAYYRETKAKLKRRKEELKRNECLGGNDND